MPKFLRRPNNGCSLSIDRDAVVSIELVGISVARQPETLIHLSGGKVLRFQRGEIDVNLLLDQWDRKENCLTGFQYVV